MAPLKVLISGGGIAGNALAFWLSNLGHAVTVVERFPTLRATGLQIDLRGHGVEVLKRMGLEQSYRSVSPPEQGLQMVDRSGRRRAYFPANRSGEGLQSFTTDWEIMRGDLCRLMYDETKERAKYVFGASIESIKQEGLGGGSVEVRFADGRTELFDLVVGADGQGSRTRKLMLGAETEDKFFPITGQYVAYFTIPRPIEEGEEYMATQYLATNHRGVMLRRSHPDKVQVYVGCTDRSEPLKHIRRGDVGAEKEALAKIMRGAGWQTDEIVRAMMTADDFYCERMGLVKLESWSKGHVALVGDAAYCPSANTGMGTTSALVGAYILAGEIGRHCGKAANADVGDGVAAALKAYDQKFRPFMDQVQKGILEGDSGMVYPSSAFGIAVAHLFLGLASFFKLPIFGWFLKEEVKDWDLPDYPEMIFYHFDWSTLYCYEAGLYTCISHGVAQKSTGVAALHEKTTNCRATLHIEVKQVLFEINTSHNYSHPEPSQLS
ncbi:hypothetical protein BKA67DRAFT_537903 [Truncatella angustata]|uniref:FAD-binding domain-containing protein n=1 Tax=Truncatella angustata TaxID=152316 RepID=A0A9P8UH54_9PEZI|nr:uncharacterized protein BKA67DRAFT_537903 [Truncatella angustata]KAH6652058.1 hypothetical protein BKA67DRAFT_537903 [Truncatella angustata]